MSDDVEMNEVTSPLLNNGVTKENNDNHVPEVDFKNPKSSEVLGVKTQFTGLSKEELEKFAKDPFWIRLRLILFILFWLIWASMLLAAILVVVLSPKCPQRPKLEFWEKKTGYWVDTLAFVDSNGDNVGDFEGLMTRLDYIQKQIGAGYIVLDPIFTGQYSSNVFGSVSNFQELDPLVGNSNSFQKLIKETRKRGLEIVLTIDFNALHESSSFLNDNPNSTMKFNNGMESWLSRDGQNSKRTYKEQSVYSSAPQISSMIDLDLRSESVLKLIKETVEMWLNFGVRGFLLTNVAFYIENVSVPIIPSNFSKIVNVSKWYEKQFMHSQIFSLDTKELLSEIRQIMNVVAKKTDKSRLLIVEAGNVGYGLTQSNQPDVMLQYLDGPDRIADMIVGREFLRNRGWNTDAKEYSTSSVRNYMDMIPKDKRKRVALTSATSTSLRTNDLIKLTAPFLLPGNPIIYFGTEIDTECDLVTFPPLNVYPQNRNFSIDNISGEWATKCNHLIMPWDNTGNGFYNGKANSTDNYIASSKNTVQSFTAIGRDETTLQLHQKLIKVREEPSLQWGEIEMFPDQNMKSGTYEIFIREANGFPKIIVALIQDVGMGKVFSFSSVCAKVVPILVYPSNANLPENKEISASNIFLKNKGGKSVHVFKCVL